MTYLHAIILSIVEGLTEFLPISSTGHLILTGKLISIPQSNFLKSFEIIIQLGAILAIIFLYKNLLFQNKEIWKKIIIAFIPTGAIGLILYGFIKEYLLGNELITVLSLFIGGLLIIIVELFHKAVKNESVSIEKISTKQALLIGLVQSLSIVPGVSRSAATILGARLFGVNKETAVIFSFLLAIPTMLAASGLDLIQNNFSFSINELILLTIGFIGSFLVALLAVKLFLAVVQKYSFIPFGIYRIIIAFFYWYFIIR